VRSLFGGERARDSTGERRGGLLDPRGIERVIKGAIPFDAVARNIERGLVGALTISTTHVGSGRTVVFIDKSAATRLAPSDDPLAVDVVTPLQAEHAAASAAIPFLFPAVRIDGDFYTDGGLRQNVPLSPAVRLGADRLLIVSPKSKEAPPALTPGASFPGPFALLGKALNALLLDRVDGDLDRLRGINRLLEAGSRQYGRGFVERVNLELEQSQERRPLRQVQATMIRPSQSLGALAAEHVRSAGFARRERGLLVRLMRRIADSSWDSELLSYLLFDGEYARRLIELGRADARARHDELVAFFADEQQPVSSPWLDLGELRTAA
jgi:NTE family protein